MKLLSSLNQYRSRAVEAKMGLNSVDEHDDYFGMFFIKVPGHPQPLKVAASRFRDKDPVSNSNPPWNHVSISRNNRCPTWEEMCSIKDIFFDKDEAVMQLHPAEKDYVNNHRFCLHIWQPVFEVIPLPPSIMVGVKDLGTVL